MEVLFIWLLLGSLFYSLQRYSGSFTKLLSVGCNQVNKNASCSIVTPYFRIA